MLMDAQAQRPQGRGQGQVPRAHHRNAVRDRGDQVAPGGDPDGLAIGQRVQQLVAVEAAPGPSGEQDADDGSHA
jgi:hypothetical protein